MIIDNFVNFERYLNLNPNFKYVVEYLNDNDLVNLELGEYEIKSRDVFIIIAEDNEQTQNKKIIEAHKKYIDIQFPLNGELKIIWKSLNDCKILNEKYDENRDVMFFEDQPDFEINLSINKFCILFPEDAHFATPPSSYFKKAIIKVKV